MRKVFGVLFALALSSMSISCVAAANTASEQGKAKAMSVDSGQIRKTLVDLQRDAKAGDLRALLRIGELFETGTILPKDPMKSCQIYSIAADHYAKVDRYDPGAPLVAKAFRLAARCYAKGPEAARGWPRNMQAAVEMYLHGSITLRDAESAFELAQLYLKGGDVPQNPAVAIDMLQAAAKKQFAPAQALLGSMMWEGKVMKQHKARGLALIILGSEHAPTEYSEMVGQIHNNAVATASNQDRKDASQLVDRWKALHGDPSRDTVATASTSAGEVSIPSPIRSPAREMQGLNLDFIGEIQSFGSLPTGAIVSPSQANTAPNN